MGEVDRCDLTCVGEVGLLQMNLRSVEGKDMNEFPAGFDDDARTFPIRWVYGDGLDLNQDLIINGRWYRYLLNQSIAVLRANRHQSLVLMRAGGEDLPVG